MCVVLLGLLQSSQDSNKNSVLRIVGRGGVDHGFISKKYISIRMRSFGEAKSKATRAYAQSG